MVGGGAAVDYCAERWNIGTAHTRCVRIKMTMERLFQTGDNTGTPPPADGTQSRDVDFAYRKFSISAGWAIKSLEANNPGKEDFAA